MSKTITSPAATQHTAYDYHKQQWVTGEPARILILAHLRDERELVAGPGGPAYLQSVAVNDSPAVVLSVIDRKIAALEA